LSPLHIAALVVPFVDRVGIQARRHAHAESIALFPVMVAESAKMDVSDSTAHFGFAGSFSYYMPLTASHRPKARLAYAVGVSLGWRLERVTASTPSFSLA
jgi:hypothetical protein